MRSISYSRAGHVPALICCEGQPRWLEGGGGPPLAVGLRTHRFTETVAFTHGSKLVLYSDGLIERPEEHIDDGLARLADAVCNRPTTDSVQDVADAILDALLPAQLRDDVVLVVKQLLRDDVPEEILTRSRRP